MQPINYLSAIPGLDLSREFAGLSQALGDYGDYAAKQREIQKAEALQKQYNADVAVYRNKPSAAAAADLALKYPQQRESFMADANFRNQQHQDAEYKALLPFAAALDNGAVDVGAKQLKHRIEAMSNSGEDTSLEQRWLGALESGDQQQINSVKAEALLGLAKINPKFAETWGQIGNEQRADELQPGLVAKGKADADKAAADAKTAGVTAEYARDTAKSGLKQAAATLGLTTAQTGQAIAATSKLNAETQKALAEAAQAKAGGDPTKTFEAEQKLRKEYATETKPFVEVKEAFRRIKSAENNGPGDIALIYGYMKMLDPGSVVREGEFATASNSGGIPTAIQNLYNKALRGERLTAGQRKTFLSQAGKLADAASVRETEVRKGLETVVKNYRLNSDNVFGIAATSDDGQKPPAPANTPVAVNPQTGERIAFRNGRWEPLK